MPLTTAAAPITFIPTNHPEASRSFYESTLGLHFVHDDGFAMVFHLGAASIMLRVVRVGTFTPQPFTILGWEVDNLAAAIDELTAKGIIFVTFEFLSQDARGIWTAPSGDHIAWFKDPDGNTLSLSQHIRR